MADDYGSDYGDSNWPSYNAPEVPDDWAQPEQWMPQPDENWAPDEPTMGSPEVPSVGQAPSVAQGYAEAPASYSPAAVDAWGSAFKSRLANPGDDHLAAMEHAAFGTALPPARLLEAPYQAGKWAAQTFPTLGKAYDQYAVPASGNFLPKLYNATPPSWEQLLRGSYPQASGHGLIGGLRAK